MRNTININAHRDSWIEIRKMFPKSSDSRRIRILYGIAKRSDITTKLLPETTDTRKDKILKGIMKDLL